MSTKSDIEPHLKGARKWRLRLLACIAVLAMALPQHSKAFSLDLDSIAAWGKFPRFAVNTYRWGDKFFNSYDSLYVIGSGKRFNIKAKVDSWSDLYDFRLNEGYTMQMLSDPSSTLGFYLTYMAVSVGYDMNIGKYFNGGQLARKRFNFQFNCSLFAVEFYNISNDIGTTIRRMGPERETERVKIPFKGINTSQWGLDLYYFFNHKRYSQAAAFAYSKLQVRSQGSFYAGISLNDTQYSFDFWDLPTNERPPLPQSWNNFYRVKDKSYSVIIGYGYNWVFHKGWVLGVSESPLLGLRHGYIVDASKTKNSFGINNMLRASLIYNYKTKWFFGIVGKWDMALLSDHEHTLIANNISAEVSAGFRFNLW